MDCKAHADKIEEFTAYIASVVGETRSYDGCELMTFNVNQDDPTDVTFIESWENREKYEHYFAWRQESGSLDNLGPMLVGPPNVRFLDEVEM